MFNDILVLSKGERFMKGKFKVIEVIFGVILFLSISALIIDMLLLINNKPSIFYFHNMKQSIGEVVVVKVNENSLIAMSKNANNYLYSIDISKYENTIFKQGQEILVLYGKIYPSPDIATYPKSVDNVGKIKILKEKSEVEIPDYILSFCYNSPDNVEVTISELTNTSIGIILVDKNDISYDYSNYQYVLRKKVKDSKYEVNSTRYFR